MFPFVDFFQVWSRSHLFRLLITPIEEALIALKSATMQDFPPRLYNIGRFSHFVQTAGPVNIFDDEFETFF